MTNSEIELIIRACAEITGASEFVVIGSQSVLGQILHAPQGLLGIHGCGRSHPPRSPQCRTDRHSIGEGSPLHSTFGYFVHGHGVETAVLPDGWRGRLMRVQSSSTSLAFGLCLEAHDLAVSKIAAGRDKNHEFVRAMLRHRRADASTLCERLSACVLNAELRQPREFQLQRRSAHEWPRSLRRLHVRACSIHDIHRRQQMPSPLIDEHLARNGQRRGIAM